MQYLNFDMEIGEGAGADYPVTVRSPAGNAALTMRFPFDEVTLRDRLKDLKITLLTASDDYLPALSTEEQAVQDFGRDLYTILLSGEAGTLYKVCQEIARSKEDTGVRLRLSISSPLLAALPWELLYDPADRRYLCLFQRTPLVRMLSLAQPVPPLQLDRPPLRILGMFASPKDQDDVTPVDEQAYMQEALKPLLESKQVELHWLAGQNWEALHNAMLFDGPWHIFHFIGHGGFHPAWREGVLALVNEQGTSDLLRASALAVALADHPSLRLVVLNACEGARGDERNIFSSTAATLAEQGVPAVLAMQHAISGQASVRLTRTFYNALARGATVDSAVVAARQALSARVKHTLEWCTPVLYLRAQDGVLFDIPAAFRTAHFSATPAQAAPPGTAEQPKTAEDWLKQGNALLQQKHYQKAIDTYYEALRVNPNYRLAHHQCGVALERLKRYEEALAAFDRALRINDHFADTHYERGFVLVCLARYQEAVDAFDRALQLGSNNPNTFYYGGWALWQLKHYKEALTAFDAAIRLNPANESAYAHKADILWQLERYEEAVVAYDQAIQRNPDNAKAFYDQVKKLLTSSHYSYLYPYKETNPYKEAVAILDQAIKLRPDDAQAYSYKVEALLHLQHYGEAVVVYDQVIALKPDDARAYYDKEKALLHLNRYKEAAAVYDQVIALKPDDARAYYAKGKALLRLQYHEGRYYFYTRKANHVLPAAVLQRFEEALNAFNKVIELYPAEASSAATNNQRKTFPRKKPADLYANAYQANASNDKEEALLDKQPDDLCADAYYYIGEILLRLHRYKETLAICDRAIKRNLQSAGTYSNIGKALYALHRYQEALDVFRQYGSSDSEAGAAKSTIFWQMAFRWGWRFSLFEALTIGGTFLLAYTFGHLGSWPWPSFVWEVVAFWLLLLVCGFLAGRQTGEEGLGSIAALGAGLFWAFVFAVAQSIVLHITNDDPIWEFHTVFDYIWFFLFEGVLVFVGVFLGFVGNAIGVGRHRRANTADVLAGEADFPPP